MNTTQKFPSYDGLVEGARHGDPKAWEGLIRTFTPMMLGTARRYRLNEADCADVMQTVWLRLAEHLDRIRDDDRIAGWLATTTRREALSVLRRREIPVATCGVEAEDRMSSPEQVVLDRDEVARTRRALQRLSERDQRLLGVLMRMPSTAYADVAAELGMPIGSIGPTRARALVRLRTELDRAQHAADPGRGSRARSDWLGKPQSAA